MKLLMVDMYYDLFLRSFYDRRPEMAGLGYGDHHRRLMAERFALFDSFPYYLRRLGWEAEVVVSNDGALQSKWASENGMRITPVPNLLANGLNVLFGKDWRFDVIKNQVERMRPDILYIQEQNILTDAMIDELKRFVRCVVIQIASPIPKGRTMKSADLVLTTLPSFVDMFRAKGLRADLFRLSFDPRILDETAGGEKRHGVTFVGGLSKIHRDRTDIFEYAARYFPMDWFGYGHDRLDRNSPLQACYRGQTWGLDMYRVLQSSRMTINCHVDVAGVYAGNMRLYEATGVGTCLVTDWKSNLHEYFEPEREVVTYRTREELVEKVRWLIDHEGEARQIAERGQKRTLREHTTELRMQELTGLLKKYF